MYASALLFAGQTTGVEQKLQAAEVALEGTEPDDKTRELIGHIAAIRATLAVMQHDAETIIAESRRALEYLHPDNLPVRTATTWTLGYAYQLQGDRAAASQAYAEAIAISQRSGDVIITIMATTGLAKVQEAENQLFLAARPTGASCNWQVIRRCRLPAKRILAWPVSLRMERLDAAESTGNRASNWRARWKVLDRFVACEVFLARLKLAQGDVAGAAAILDEADQSVRQHNFVHRMPEVAAAQVLTLLRQGNLAAAAHLAQTHELPTQPGPGTPGPGKPSAALAVLEPFRQQVEAKGWADERLKVMVLQAVALHAHGEKDEAVQVLGDALALAEPGGFIRIFVDEGTPMAQLLSEAAARGIMPDYTGKLLAAFEAEEQKSEDESYLPPAHLPSPLSSH